MRNGFANMLSYTAALELIESLALQAELPEQEVSVAQASGCIAAQDVLAPSARPEADISAMDGYAFAHEAMRASPEGLLVHGLSVAGAQAGDLPFGYAQKILTGARIPTGADCVMAVERMAPLSDTGRIRPLCSLAEKGANIRRAGEEFHKGAFLLKKGQLIDWRHVALLACQGIQSVTVKTRPRVAIVANGGELSPNAADHRYDSNTPMLAAMLAAVGVQISTFCAPSDCPHELAATLTAAWQAADLIVTTGGISVGMTDNVMDAFLSLGAHLVFRGVKMRPGKPLSVFKKNHKIAFCLPGNPGASALCAQVLLLPYLRGIAGQPVMPEILLGEADFELKPLPDTTHFLPVTCTQARNGTVFSLLPSVGASDLSVLARATAFLQIDAQENSNGGRACRAIPFQGI